VKDSSDTRTAFRYNSAQGISSLDPAFARTQNNIWAVQQLFGGLVQLDDQLNVAPLIAREWDISPEGLSYTFLLRKDVFFHDHPVFPGGNGRRVTAQDFEYSFNRILDPSVASPGAWVFNFVNQSMPGTTKGFKALNDSVFTIHLVKPFPAFLGLLTMPYCSVVPEEVVLHHGKDFRRNPIGTGPFKFRLWREGEKLVLLKHERYFEHDGEGTHLPYLDAVSVSFINDRQSEFLEFIKGNLDFISGVHASYKDELLTRAGELKPKYSNRFRMYTFPYLNTEYLGILVDTSLANVKSSPLRIREVRQAINYGFNRARMMSYLRNNLGTPARHGFVPEGLPSFSTEVKGYDYNPDKARQLLVLAGFPGGAGLEEIVLTTTSDYLDLFEFMQHELASIGIRLKIEVSPGAAFRESVAQSRLNLFRGSWIADYPDAENYLALFYSRNFTPAGPNYTRFSSQEFDAMYESSFFIADQSERLELYRKMDQLIMDEAVVIPLYYDKVVRFTAKTIAGMSPNPLNMLNLKYVRKINPKYEADDTDR
jgi:oligopeptide transport system substrate-binding protein